MVASARFSRAELLAMLAVAALGLMILPQPFGWDQALFAMGARTLNEGGTLYRDVWDVKQPGIYLFYWLGGSLFGFHEVGFHVLELIWNLALAAVAIVTLRRERPATAWGPAAALLVAGYPLAVLYDWHLTQIESLVGLPLLVCAVSATAAARAGRRALVPAMASGIAGGIALVFKLAFLPIVGAFWVTALATARRSDPPARSGTVIAAAGMMLGFAIPAFALALWLGTQGTLAEAWWVWTVYPREVLANTRGFRLTQLADGCFWFAGHWAAVLGLAGFGLVFGVKRGSTIAIQMGLWLALALGIILVQRWSYWQYQFVLLAVPAGLLASLGIEDLHTALAPWLSGSERRVRTIALGVALSFCSALPIGILALHIVTLAHHGFALTPEDRLGFQDFVSRGGKWSSIRREVAFLSEPGALPGPVFVVGNPLFNWLSGRSQGAPRHGAVLIDHVNRRQWERTLAHFRAQPPAYVVFERGQFEDGETEHPEAAGFFAWLHRNYARTREGAVGIWWERRNAGATN